MNWPEALVVSVLIISFTGLSAWFAYLSFKEPME